MKGVLSRVCEGDVTQNMHEEAMLCRASVRKAWGGKGYYVDHMLKVSQGGRGCYMGPMLGKGS